MTATTTWTPCAVCWLLRHTATPATQTVDGRALCDAHSAALAPACQSCTRQLCTCPLPAGPAIEESNRRAAEARQGLYSPLARLEGSGF